MAEVPAREPVAAPAAARRCLAGGGGAPVGPPCGEGAPAPGYALGRGGPGGYGQGGLDPQWVPPGGWTQPPGAPARMPPGVQGGQPLYCGQGSQPGGPSMALGGYNDFFGRAGTPGTYSDGGGGSLYGGQLPPHESREQFTLRAPQLSTSAGDSPQMDTPAPRGGKRSRMSDSDRSWENRQWGVVRAGMRLLGSATPEMFVASSAVWSILLEYRPDGAPDDAFVLGKVSRHPSGKFAQAVHRWMWTVSAEATLRAGSEDYVSMRSSRAWEHDRAR